MILSGLETVAIVQADDTDFSDTIWLNLVSDEGEYKSEYSTVKDYVGQFYNLYKKHEFSFKCIDSEKFYKLQSLADNNTSVVLFGYGIKGAVVWRESSVITLKEVKSNKPGEHQMIEVMVSAEGVGLDIQVGVNLLRDTLRTCDYAITSAEWTITNTAFTAPVDTSNPAFSGKTYKLDDTSSPGTVEIKEFKNHFPVKPGMKFRVRADTYSASASIKEILINEYSSSLQASTSVATASSSGSVEIDGTVTITGTDTTFIKFGLGVVQTTADIGFFDNLQLSYKSTSEVFQRG